MSRWNLIWMLGLFTAALTGISLTYSAPSRDVAVQRKHDNLRLLVDVLEEVQHKYVKDLDPEKMRELVENMINGGLERLDPHSGFINADEFKQFQHQSKGKFGGVGIRIGIDRVGQFFVESPMAGTPAYEAGVMAGDIILKVDGKTTENVSLKRVVEWIQGDPGTDVRITVMHEGQNKPVDLTMKRAEIKVESVQGDLRVKENLKEWDFWIDPVTRIGYVRISTFAENTAEELGKVLEPLQRAGMQGLVIDLRNNPGGLLRSAVQVASLFLPEGKNVVTTKGRGGVIEEVYNASPSNPKIKTDTYYPIAVLLNRYSASASEIVAAALQDHARAIVVGERSYGKGSVQNVIPMEGSASALKLTTASYWRPSGRNIHRFPDSKDEDEWGVKPNDKYEVKLSDEERLEYFKWRRERDILRRPGEPAPKLPEDQASEKKEEKSEQAEKNGKKREPFRDKVLDRAVEYVRAEISRQQKDARAPQAPQALPALASERLPSTLQPLDARVAAQDRNLRRED